MSLAFFTNIPSHYQIALSKAWHDLLGSQYSMICWNKSIDEYRRLGWVQDYSYEWLINAWASEDENAKAYSLLQSADIVIWGYAPIEVIRERIIRGKLTFCYTERPFKRGRWRIFDPRVVKGLRNKYLHTSGSAHHLLAVGPHCAADFRFLRMFPERMWRWGYFPEVPALLSSNRNNPYPVVLWAGRMIPWKRVDLLIRAAAWARNNGTNSFRLKLIGYGSERDQLRLLVTKYQIGDMCEFIDPQSPEEVGNSMEEADIYVLPSDKNEGWGVVVNEAMSRGCCVIGNHDAGAVPWLIKDGVSGRVFREHDPRELGAMLRDCINQPRQRIALGATARTTIKQLWSPQVAAERLLILSERLKQGLGSPYLDGGPCSSI